MNYRMVAIFVLGTVLLSSCTMSLAEDVTPPPGAVQAPQATHGPVFPLETPDPDNGGAIYAEKCAACHGELGMGDGPQAEQLPVPVAALGSPELAAKASPADWFLTVTLGNIDNFMPPFSSLTDQQRWDVVAYSLTLSTSATQIEQGEQLFNSNCTDCPLALFSDQQSMTNLSADELIDLIRNGQGDIPAFGSSLSEQDLLAVAMYLRSLSFGPAYPTPAPASATPSEVKVEAETTPGAEAPTEGTSQSELTPEPPAVEGVGSVSGKILNGSGGDVTGNLTVTLYGFDHGTDATTAPVETVNLTAKSQADGSFRFDQVEMPEGRIFYAQVDYNGLPFQSDPAFTEAGLVDVTLPDVTIYESTTQTSGLVTEELFVFSEFNPDGTVRIFEQFYITNQSDQVVLVTTDGSSIPFLPMPAGAADLSFQPTQDSAALLPSDTGFAMPPSEIPYGIIAFYTMPYGKELELNLPFALPVASISVVVPEGIKITSQHLIDEGVREMQPGTTFQVYSGSTLNAGEALDMTFSGKVKSASGVSSFGTDYQPLLIGIGAFGFALILAGVWLYLRDRRSQEGDYELIEDEQNGFETSEEVMDAIIALDDLHRAGKIPEEAYHSRRAELKDILKDLT
jgi:mono/diheme cytochrome c family protein